MSNGHVEERPGWQNPIVTLNLSEPLNLNIHLQPISIRLKLPLSPCVCHYWFVISFDGLFRVFGEGARCGDQVFQHDNDEESVCGRVRWCWLLNVCEIIIWKYHLLQWVGPGRGIFGWLRDFYNCLVQCLVVCELWCVSVTSWSLNNSWCWLCWFGVDC